MNENIIEKISKYIIKEAQQNLKSNTTYTVYTVSREEVLQQFGLEIEEYINNKILTSLCRDEAVNSAELDTDGFNITLTRACKKIKSKSIDRIMGGISLVLVIPFTKGDAIQYGKELYAQQGQSICDMVGAWCIRNNVCMRLAIRYLLSDHNTDEAFGTLILNMMITFHKWMDKYIDYGMISNDDLLDLELKQFVDDM